MVPALASLNECIHYECEISSQCGLKSADVIIWTLFFSANKRKHDGSEDNGASINARFKNALHMAMACGDYEKLQQGVFENYLNIKFKDAKLQNVLGKYFPYTIVVQIFFLINC